MKFYCIVEGYRDSVRLLEKACEERKIDFIKIDPDRFNYLSLENKFEDGDLLYRILPTEKGRTLEKLIISQKHFATFYNYTLGKPFQFSQAIEFMIIYQMSKLPIPKTIYVVPQEKNILKDYVDYLGGFPIILKALGGSHGVGVMKIDSLSSLYSVADYLSSRSDHLVLRQFINTTTSARLIVLGDKVVDSIEYFANKGDFRSGGSPNVRAKKFSAEICDLAIKAVKLSNLEFGGVDILMDQAKKLYVAEVNFPCYFPRCQLLTKTDIAGMMLDYLLRKSKCLK